LTERQQRLVTENLGLVGVHLRSRVPGLRRVRINREWDDFFQEGCLGLIRAARSYRPARGIAFAAFALARISSAVHRALRRAGMASRLHRLGGRRELSACVTPKASPAADPAEVPDTVGRRLGEKYERAVRRAGRRASGRARNPTGRRLVRALTEERLLIPEPSSRTPLRRVAADSRMNYSWAAKCESRMQQSVRRALEADPEFRALRHCARRLPGGAETPVSPSLDRDLAAATGREFTRRVRKADAARRNRLLTRWMEVSLNDTLRWLEKHAARLTPLERERLLAEGAAADAAGPTDHAR
jgi:hypothetical protein